MHCSFYVLHKLSMTCFILCDSIAKGIQNVLIHMYSEMQVILCTHFRLVNTHICYNLLLLLPAAWEILVYEVTCFFVCLFVFLHQYESAIISFCVRIECLVSMTQKCGLG